MKLRVSSTDDLGAMAVDIEVVESAVVEGALVEGTVVEGAVVEGAVVEGVAAVAAVDLTTVTHLSRVPPFACNAVFSATAFLTFSCW